MCWPLPTGRGPALDAERKNRMSVEKKFALLASKNREAEAGGGAERVAKHHEQGKLTARERLEFLFDPGSFVEVDKWLCDGLCG
jgi:acetyl-CoA carboxylase carboxyltransferase component